MWKILDLIDSIDRNHQSYIYKIYSKVGNFEDANDIMQDIYIYIYIWSY